MKERGILFSAPMVRAILAGRKTQTRRLIAGFQDETTSFEYRDGIARATRSENGAHWPVRCPYGVAGDRLWVREAWAAHFMYDDVPARLARTNPTIPGDNYWCRADGEDAVGSCGCPASGRRGRWRPGIHMPRWASRITLEVTEVRIQRLGEISAGDAQAEGIETFDADAHAASVCASAKAMGTTTDDARAWFAALWDSINGARAPWAANPWVWAISFRRVKP